MIGLLSLFLRPNKIGPNKIYTFNSCYDTIIDKLISFGCYGNDNWKWKFLNKYNLLTVIGLLSLFLRPNKIGPNKIYTFNSCYDTIIDKLISFGCYGNDNWKWKFLNKYNLLTVIGLLSLFLRPNKIGPNKIYTFNSCYDTIIDKLTSFGCCGNDK